MCAREKERVKREVVVYMLVVHAGGVSHMRNSKMLYKMHAIVGRDT